MSSVIITSVVTGGTNNHATVSEEANTYATDFVTQGILGTFTNTNGSAPATGSFGVNQNTGSDMNILIKGSGNTTSGQAIAYVSCVPTGQDTQMLRARMASDYTPYAINSNSSGSVAYDWIYLQANPTNANTPDAAADNVINLFTSRSTSNSADNGSPPTYGTLLAVVTVANGATAITNANISDRRTQSGLSATTAGNSTGWTTLPYPISYGANNGNKEFTVTTPNNLTGLLSPGMKKSFARSVTPPSQCMVFASASSQYATLASPAGITFTSAFTCEAWIYPLGYAGGTAEGGIIGNTDDTTKGWAIELTSTGQIRVFYGGSSSFTDFQTYQSVQLNRWTHVAAAVTSVSSKTALIYIDGQLVPSFSSTTAATALTQGTQLTVGGLGAGISTKFFNGYISEARVWSVAQSSANIQANMGISIPGASSNLVAYFQGNGNFNDGSSNTNNLAAVNGASATQANNPYNATEYAFITKIAYSNPTTTITLKAIGGTVPNMTLNSPQYSVVDCPFGWPSTITSLNGLRLLELPLLTQQTTASTSLVPFAGSNSSTVWSFTVPSNCNKIKIKIFNTTLGITSNGTMVFEINNSSTEMVQINTTTTNNALTSEALLPVVPGSVFNFNITWFTSAGTATWSSSASTQEQAGVTIEAA